MGVGAHALFGRGDADHAEHLERDVAAVGRALASLSEVGMPAGDGFHELLADRAHRVEGRHGVLDDEADVGAAQGAVFLFREADELAAAIAD